MKRVMVVSVLVLVASAAFAAGARELAWPDPERTVTVVVPYSAGGGTDLVFRPLVEEMRKHLDVNIIVSNIGGAGSATGTNEVLSQPADGYTLLASGTHTVAATLQGLTEGYRQLEGIAGLNWDPFIIAVHKDSPWQNMKQLVDDARRNPGKISLGNAGMGGATGVASVGLNLAFGRGFNVTPFSGGSDLLANVLGRHCDVGIFSQSEILSNIGSLRPLVILYPEHSKLPGLDRIPTLEEAGFQNPSVPAGSFRSISVRSGTSAEVKQKLADAVRKAFQSPAYQQFMQKQGLLPAYYELGALDDYFNELVAAYTPILRDAGLLK